VAEPVRVGELLAALPGLAARLAEAQLLGRWPELAGPAARRSRAAHVEAGVLHVFVETSGWLHRLTLETDALLARCRTITDVRAIRFHLAPRPESPPDPPVRGQGESSP
jgi:predicted nucleic acid-binding Zn ribbon protein